MFHERKILEKNSDLYLAMDNGKINRGTGMINRSFVFTNGV